MATYNIVAVQRTPQSATTPTLAVLGPIEGALQWTNRLNEAPECRVDVNTNALLDDIKDSLRDPISQPMEVWVYRDSTLVFAGPMVGYELTNDILSITARGLEFYTAYMLIDADETWTTTDQYTIATDVIDNWQAQTYGNYGIDTSGIGLSGTTRSLDIPGATEPWAVYDFLREWGAIDNGFDWWVDPESRDLMLASARGSDKSDSVFLELGIRTANVRLTVAPGVIASEVLATGTGVSGSPITTTVSNATLRAAWGRAGLSIGVDGDPDATTLADTAQGVLDNRATAFFVPGTEMIPVTGADVDDFDVGDTVSYTFDAGLGQTTGSFRVGVRTVAVAADGQETISVEFT